jgi:hypothetical protein
LQDRQLKKTRNGIWFVIELCMKVVAAVSRKKDHVNKANDIGGEPSE